MFSSWDEFDRRFFQDGTYVISRYSIVCAHNFVSVMCAVSASFEADIYAYLRVALGNYCR